MQHGQAARTRHFEPSALSPAAGLDVIVREESGRGEQAVCKYTRDCSDPFVCIEHRCTCNPSWAQPNLDCTGTSWNTCALIIMLVFVSFMSVFVLTKAAKNSSALPRTAAWRGLREMYHIIFRWKTKRGESLHAELGANALPILHFKDGECSRAQAGHQFVCVDLPIPVAPCFCLGPPLRSTFSCFTTSPDIASFSTE